MTDESDSTDLTRLATSEERDAAVKRLTTAFADDAIPVDEFERRVAEVWRATTSQALVALTQDLPASQSTSDSSAPAPMREPSAVDVPRAGSRRVASIMSSIERQVNGPVPERLHVRALMGSIELDLTDADFPPGVTEIRVRAIMGNIELELPDHVEVEDYGRSFMGTFVVRAGRRRGPRDPDRPVVRIVGRSIMSNIEVETDDD